MPMATSAAVPSYRGRFAPSPSGPLHAGSLVAALGSYLDARAHHGTWLVRIEDIDPPREISGAADTILQQLESHGLHWDEPVTWQSQNSPRYLQRLQQLQAAGLTYFCTCTRAEIKARGNHYDGFCRDLQRPPNGAAVRLLNLNPVQQFFDRWHGSVQLASALANEDFVLRRRDQLWAYQLAVVADDYASGITDIVRGEDLLHASGWQLTLWQIFSQLDQGVSLPRLAHLPLILGEDGRKLSKQNHATPIIAANAAENLHMASNALGLKLPHPNEYDSLETYLQSAVQAWQGVYANTPKAGFAKE